MRVETDEMGRLQCMELLPPNTAFNAELQDDGSVLLEPVSGELAIPVVNPVATQEGFLMLPVKLDRKKVAAAIRADRDAR